MCCISALADESDVAPDFRVVAGSDTSIEAISVEPEQEEAREREQTDQDIYFDGWGWEVYGEYQIKGPVWAVGGWNYLAPDQDELQAGAYLVKYGVVGLRYSFDNFSKMLFANAKFDEGRKADGTGFGNTYAIGIRWDLP